MKIRGILFIVAVFLPLSVHAQTTETLTFTFSMADFAFETDAQGQVFIASEKHALVFGEDLSKPAIPYRTVSVLSKPDEVYSNVSFTYGGAVKKNNVRLAPNPEPIEVGAEPGLIRLASYPNGLYPSTSERGYFLMQGLMDGHRILNFRFSPFQYNATTKELTLYTTVTMRVTTKAASYDVPESKGSMNGLIPDLVENAEKEEAYYPGTTPSEGSYEWGPGYLIICPEDLRDAFEPLRQWKMEKGLYAITRTLEDIYNSYEGETEPIKIKRCIQDYYLHHGLRYVLLGGGGANFPMVYCGLNDIPSDWFYACLDDSEEFAFDWDADGDGTMGELGSDKIDIYPEIMVGRVPLENSAEVQAFIAKSLGYEKNPPMDNWSKKLLFTGVSIEHSDDEPTDSEIMSRIYYDSCIAKVFDAEAQFYFGRKYDNSITKESLQDKMQEGFHIIHMMTHGGIEVFELSDSITPQNDTIKGLYGLSDAEQMVCDKPSLFIALSCKTNAFDYSKCLGRYFIKSPSNGVFNYIGTTRSSWYSGSVPYSGIFETHRDLMNALFSSHGESIGVHFNVTKMKMDYIGWQEDNFWGLNMCGDPEISLYLESPKEFASFSISLNDDKFLVDAGVDSCTFAVRFKRASGAIYKREYRENVRTYEIPSDEIENCEITLMHADYIPMTLTLDPKYIQNVTYSGTVNISGDVIVAGREITDKKPVGNVIIQSGKTTFSAEKGVFLAPGFEVKKGASFEAKIKK